jgi:hypothetical protein
MSVGGAAQPTVNREGYGFESYRGPASSAFIASLLTCDNAGRERTGGPPTTAATSCSSPTGPRVARYGRRRRWTLYNLRTCSAPRPFHLEARRHRRVSDGRPLQLLHHPGHVRRHHRRRPGPRSHRHPKAALGRGEGPGRGSRRPCPAWSLTADHEAPPRRTRACARPTPSGRCPGRVCAAGPRPSASASGGRTGR